MASPYDGLEEADLLEIKANLLRILTGKRFVSQNVPGLNYTRKIESLAEVRTELQYVQQALDAKNPATRPVTRSYMKAT